MISILVPVYNECECLAQTCEQIVDVLERQRLPFELILVDDGSTDGSNEIEKQLSQGDPRIKLIQLSRNFGHQVAITAGLDYASGQVTIMMDADLQHPPEIIPAMIAKWEEGFDVVETVRLGTDRASWFKRTTSGLFYGLLNRLANVQIAPGTADFRLLDRKVVESFRQIHERDRFIRGLMTWIGFRRSQIPYHAPARYAGKSKYSTVKMVRFAFDGLTSFSAIPLYLSGLVGMIVSVLSFLYSLQAVYYRYFTNQTVEGWTSVIVAVLFLGGIDLVSLGVLGIYVGRIYTETKGRPLYLVQHLRGFERRLDDETNLAGERAVPVLGRQPEELAGLARSDDLYPGETPLTEPKAREANGETTLPNPRANSSLQSTRPGPAR